MKRTIDIQTRYLSLGLTKPGRGSEWRIGGQIHGDLARFVVREDGSRCGSLMVSVFFIHWHLLLCIWV